MLTHSKYLEVGYPELQNDWQLLASCCLGSASGVLMALSPAYEVSVSIRHPFWTEMVKIGLCHKIRIIMLSRLNGEFANKKEQDWDLTVKIPDRGLRLQLVSHSPYSQENSHANLATFRQL